MPKCVEPAVKSFIDNDLYKFTMQQFLFHRRNAGDSPVEYSFKCRDKGIEWADEVVAAIKTEIDAYKKLRITGDDLEYLRSLVLFTDDYLSWLKSEANPWNKINIELSTTSEKSLVLKIKGTWLDTILLEVPLLAIINECFFKTDDAALKSNFKKGDKNLDADIKYLKKYGEGVKVIEFGTRRRYSADWQRHVLERLMNETPDNLRGTSNLHFAKTLGLKASGTMAHELFMGFQRIVPLEQSQEYVLDAWMEEYGDKLGIALTDTVTTDAFIKILNRRPILIRKYRGFRNDSGDPILWLGKIHSLLMSNRKSWMICDGAGNNKTLVFSDNLNLRKAVEILSAVRKIDKDDGIYNVAFGIGTYLTNHLARTPLNIVIKLVKCNGEAVGKLSDDMKKSICDNDAYLEHLKNTFGAT